MLHRMGWQHELVVFLGEKYYNSQEQRYASFVLCNIYLLPEREAPRIDLTEHILGILEAGRTNAKIVENVLFLLSNLVSDHPLWR